MREFFVSLGTWNWLILGVALFVLETLAPGVHFLWFGLAAVLVGGIALSAEELGIGFSLPLQLITYGVLSVAAVFVIRRYMPSSADESDQPNLNVRGQQYVGRTYVVAEAIQGGRGRIRVADTLWTAEGDDAAVGAKVKVTGVNGTVLVVTAV